MNDRSSQIVKGVTYMPYNLEYEMDYTPNGPGVDVFYRAAGAQDMNIYIKDGDQMVKLPIAATSTNTDDLSGSLSWSPAATQQIAADIIPILSAESIKDRELYLKNKNIIANKAMAINYDSNNDRIPDVKLADTDWGIAIVGASGPSNTQPNSIKYSHRFYPIPIFYSLENNKINKDVLNFEIKEKNLNVHDGTEPIKAISTFTSGNRQIATLPPMVTQLASLSSDKEKDIIELSWVIEPDKYDQLAFQLTTWHGGTTSDGKALIELAASGETVDIDGDGVPDRITVETSSHPFVTKSEQNPDGLDHSQTVPVHSRVGVTYGNPATILEHY